MKTLRINKRIQLDPGLEPVSLFPADLSALLEPDRIDLEVRRYAHPAGVGCTVVIFGAVGSMGAAVFSDEVYSSAQPLAQAPGWALELLAVLVAEFEDAG